MNRVRQRLQNGLTSLLAGLAFLGLSLLLLGLLLALTVHVAKAPAPASFLAALEIGLGLSLIALVPALLLGTFIALYWVEYHDDPLAVFGLKMTTQLAKLPELFVATTIVALVPSVWRESMLLLAFATFVPAFVFVATSVAAQLTRMAKVYRAAVLALGVPRHHWTASAILRIMPRALTAIGVLTFGRLLTAAAPLLVLAPTSDHAPLALALLRDDKLPNAAMFVLSLLAMLLLTKIAGRALLGRDLEGRS